MKKKYLRILFFLVCFFLTRISLETTQARVIDNDENERVICHCTFWGKCKASGSRVLCAQSRPGGNVSCSSYNSNC